MQVNSSLPGNLSFTLYLLCKSHKSSSREGEVGDPKYESHDDFEGTAVTEGTNRVQNLSLSPTP